MVEFFSAVFLALAGAAPVIHNLGEIAEGGRRVVDFADRILGWFRKKVPAAQQQTVIQQALAQAASMSQAEFDRTIEKLGHEVLGDKPPEEVKTAIEYVKLFRGRIRSTFPSLQETTTFIINQPEDLGIIIPPRPPRFNVGDSPSEAPRWILVERLAIGGFGEVWKARGKTLQNNFSAFKFCLDPIAQRAVFDNQLEIEELITNNLARDPNIVRLMDARLEKDDIPWLQFEYVSGGHLGDLVATWADDTGVRAVMALKQIGILANTLAQCHHLTPRRVIHRDMKPANVLHEDGILKITDFGIGNAQARHVLNQARVAEATGMTQSRPFINASTPMYASDQQKLGERPHPADDVHALGVMLYQMIVGNLNRPLPRDYIAMLERRHICKELISLVSQSIASEREDRYQDAGELAEAIKALPKTLIVRAVVDPLEDRKRRYLEFDREAIDAKAKNEQARQLFDKRQWKEAKAVMDSIFHPILHDQELYKAVSLYAEGKRLKNSLGMEFAWVPRGDSWLGGGGGTVGSRKFTLEKGVWAGIYPVTQAEWMAVMGNNNNPSNFKDNPRFPVEMVSWDTITNSFLVELNKKFKNDGYLYRLPTEDEWEYICRGGPITQAQSGFHYYFARSKTDLTPNPTNELTQKMANFGQGSNGKPSDVGSFLPNSLGVYDMHGNVWEWTSSAEGSSRVGRGGNWGNDAEHCAAAYRFSVAPTNAFSGLGFRLLAVPLNKPS